MQHFLLSAKARTLSLKSVFRMGEDKAYQTFCDLRWTATDGAPVCPRCGCTESYSITTRRKFKCVGCGHQFSVTSGTIFASRKLSFTDLLAAIAIFVNGAKGVSALQVSRDLDVQYKTAFVLSHKLREAMAAETTTRTLSGTVEVDGAYFGGYIKPANHKADRRDRRLLKNQNGLRQSVIIMRERTGRSLTSVGRTEAAGVAVVAARVATSATIHADEASHWDALHGRLHCAPHQPQRLLLRRHGLHQYGGKLFQPPSPRRDRDAPQHRRGVPWRLRERDGLARGQPPRR